MQFVKGGPNVPDHLLRLHEEGKVVFFCGAGISVPAGLPTFSRLVKQLSDKLRVGPSKKEMKNLKPDESIGLMEEDYIGGRFGAREKVMEFLSLNLDDDPNAIATHQALLNLARRRGDKTRLVTTNFDRIFEEVRESTIRTYQAPALPVANDLWDGLVYLHGLLPSSDVDAGTLESALDDLVLSDSDFRLAYNLYGWANRFIIDMFRNYTVCFVGYGVNDPPVRSITDALAFVMRRQGESSPLPERFVFAGYSQEEGEAGRERVEEEWENRKKITPILYRDDEEHRYLHETLREWSRVHSNAIAGKKEVVDMYANRSPSESTKEDNFNSRMRWAFSDPSGSPAAYFAKMEPLPSFEWLGPLAKAIYDDADLGRFGVTLDSMNRPSPYILTSRMDVVLHSTRRDKVMTYLMTWLARHLDDPELIVWIAPQSVGLHERFIWEIRHNLNQGGFPIRPAMRMLWGLLITGRLEFYQSREGHLPVWWWYDRFASEGLTEGLRSELREMLSPRVSIREGTSFPWWIMEKEGEEEMPSELVNCDIVCGPDTSLIFERLLNDQKWKMALPSLLEDFDLILRDTMRLTKDLGLASDNLDNSYRERPAICREHKQNENKRMSYPWTILIDFICEAWLKTADSDRDRARQFAESWWQFPHPLSKRLALFAATKRSDVVSPPVALNWLLEGDYWLWADVCKYEVCQLLLNSAPKLDAEGMAELEKKILSGLPSAFKQNENSEDEDSEKRWEGLVDFEVWLRLALLQKGLDSLEGSKTSLSPQARNKLKAMRKKDKDLSVDEEYLQFAPGVYIEVSWYGEPEEERLKEESALPPPDLQELVARIMQVPDHKPLSPDEWEVYCRNNFEIAVEALLDLAKSKNWPEGRWRVAFNAWSTTDELSRRSWGVLSPVFLESSDDFLTSITDSISMTGWLIKAREIIDDQEENLVALFRRILNLWSRKDMGGVDNDADFQAINDAAGRLTNAFLLDWWRRGLLKAEGKLPDYIKSIFTDICDVENTDLRYARTMLARTLNFLFGVDEEWARQHLLPLFEWRDSELSKTEAANAWQGLLQSQLVNFSIIGEIESSFLRTAEADHYSLLGRVKEDYGEWLTLVALEGDDIIERRKLANATNMLPEGGLLKAISTVSHLLRRAGEQREKYWVDKVAPYLEDVWPTSRKKYTPKISERIYRLCVDAGDAFPLATQWLFRLRMQPPQSNHDVMLHSFAGTDICEKFPEESLKFLYALVGNSGFYLAGDLKRCLEKIKGANPELEEDYRFKELVARAEAALE